MAEQKKGLGVFEKYLTLWIIVCIIVGLLIGRIFPWLGPMVDEWQVFQISVPIAIVIFLILFPVFVTARLERMKDVFRYPFPTTVATILVWVVKPLVMFAMAGLILAQYPGYAAGITILGVAPCTILTLYWSMFARANMGYAIALAALYTVIIAIVYAPYASWLAGMYVDVPMGMVFFTAFAFLILPLGLAVIIRRHLYNQGRLDWLEQDVAPILKKISTVAILALLILLFTLQGEHIINRPGTTLLVAAPFLITMYLMFAVTIGINLLLRIPYELAVVIILMAASQHFEVAIGVASTVFGLDAPETFATVVGPLFEIPVMLSMAHILLKVRHKFTSMLPESEKTQA